MRLKVYIIVSQNTVRSINSFSILGVVSSKKEAEDVCKQLNEAHPGPCTRFSYDCRVVGEIDELN